MMLHPARLWKVGSLDKRHQRRAIKGVCTYVAIAFLNEDAELYAICTEYADVGDGEFQVLLSLAT